MAYTYQDFLNAAESAGKLNSFTTEDMNAAKTNPNYGLELLDLQKKYDSASTAAAKAAALTEINTYRKNNTELTTATSVGDQMSSQINNAIKNKNGEFAYQNQNLYNDFLNRATSPGSFEYDYETDPLYAAYENQYRREGDRATKNTLAEVSAQTGGMPSSWAVSAAAQAADYYAQQLTDKIPELRAQAYNEYLNNYNIGLQGFNAVSTDRNTSYQEWLDGVNRAIETERYETEKEQWEREFNRLLNNDQTSAEQWEQQYKSGIEQWNKSYELELYNLGLTPEQIDNIMHPSTDTNSVTGAPFSRNLKKGANGADVTELQAMLANNGYSIAIDGSFGSGTEAAVRAFQKQNGLKADGIAGKNTIAALGGTWAGTKKTSRKKTDDGDEPTPTGVSNEEYKKIEAGLKALPDAIKIEYIDRNNNLSDEQKYSLGKTYKLQ